MLIDKLTFYLVDYLASNWQHLETICNYFFLYRSMNNFFIVSTTKLMSCILDVVSAIEDELLEYRVEATFSLVFGIAVVVLAVILVILRRPTNPAIKGIAACLCIISGILLFYICMFLIRKIIAPISFCSCEIKVNILLYFISSSFY